MLILFDIDGTLLSTHGLGIRAITSAGVRAFGPTFTTDGVEFAGRLDPVILAASLRASSFEAGAESVARLRAAYAEELAGVFGRAESPLGGPCPGVPELLDVLDADGRAVLGVLTGNFEETGRLKLTHCGIDPDRFAVAVWGDEGGIEPPDRAHLPPVGVRRFEALTGRSVAPHDVVVIGDTVHDVACAKAHGMRALGVATGRTPAADLAAAGADLAVDTLADTRAIVGWLFDRRG